MFLVWANVCQSVIITTTFAPLTIAIVAVLGILVFQLKRRPPDYIPKKMKKHVEGKPLKGKDRVDGSGYGSALPPEKLPYLVELSPGEKAGPIGKCILLV